MELIAAVAVGFGVAVTLVALRLTVQAGAHAIVLMCFAAGSLKSEMPLRFLILLVICLVLVHLLWRGWPPYVSVARNKAFAIAGVLLTLLVLAFFLGTDVLSPEFSDPVFRYFVLFPGAFLLGLLISHDERMTRFFARTFIGWATVFALLASVESLGENLLFPRPDLANELDRFDRQRAILLSEHPLVLAVLFLIAIPLAWRYVSHRGARLVIVTVAVGGIAATGSRGALALFALWVALALLMRSANRSRLPQVVAIVVLAGGLAYLASAAPTSATLNSRAPDAASVEYRFQLYSVLVDSLARAPFGWGIPGLPDGVYLIASAFGTKDLATSVDSEIALAAFDFGLVGLAFFAAMVLYAVRPAVLKLAEGQAAILVLLSGFYLALHAWTGLPVILMILLGLCTRANRPPPNFRQLQSVSRVGRVRG